MTHEAVEYIGEVLSGLGLNYAFDQWQENEIPDTYFTGIYIEHPSTTREESGKEESTFILRGYTRHTLLALEQAREKIKRAFPITTLLPSGSAIAIFYDTADPVPQAGGARKSIKINLNVQEWRVL